MPPLRPRTWLRKYGSWGVLMAAVYLGLRPLWAERRRALPAGLVLLVAGTLLMHSREKRHSIPAPLPPPISDPAPAPSVSPPEVQEQAAKDELESTRQVREGRNRWRLEIWRSYNEASYGSYIKFYRNNRFVRRVYATEIGETYLEFGKAKFATRFPLIVLDAVPGAGHAHTIRLYTLRCGKLIQMLQLDGQYGGPIFRDFDGDGKPEWMFDDYDFYKYFREGPKYYLVYKELRNGKLKLWKRLPNVHHHCLPPNLGQEEW